MNLQCSHNRFGLLFFQTIIIVALTCPSAFADGIVLKNGMQLVVSIRDTSGDSISIQEGLYAGEIAKSLIASFWYKGHQFLYVNKSNSRRSAASIISSPAVKIVSPEVSGPLVHDTSAFNTDSTNNVKDSANANTLIQAPSPDTLSSSEAVSQVTDTISDLQLETPRPLEGTEMQKEQIESTSTDQTGQDTDIAVEESDDSKSLQLFDPEYTNEELAGKKRTFLTILAIGCAMGVTSTATFFTVETIDIKVISVPFMITSIPLSIVGGIKSNEYIKRYRSAEYKKRRAQMSLSLQINRADLLIKF